MCQVRQISDLHVTFDCFCTFHCLSLIFISAFPFTTFKWFTAIVKQKEIKRDTQ